MLFELATISNIEILALSIFNLLFAVLIFLNGVAINELNKRQNYLRWKIDQFDSEVKASNE